MKSRAEQRRTLDSLLALASRPGTPAEGETALAMAFKYAKRHGFRIVTRNRCRYCGDGFVTRHTGRPRIYCSGRCRVAAHRARVTKL